MNVISPDKLYDYDYSVNVINAGKMLLKEGQSYSCIDSPKTKSVFTLISDCKAEYILPDNSRILAKSGDIVYIPIGSRYLVRFYELESSCAHILKINFSLFDEDSSPFILNDTIMLFRHLSSSCIPLFTKVVNHSESAVVRPSKMKSATYEILSILSEKSRAKSQTKGNFSQISDGINYLEHNTEQSMSISELSALCNVSEIYFRRLFKEYSGMSPVKYRIKSKVEKAKLCLEYEDMTIREISDYLGFVSPAYFSRQFRVITGMTPSEYRAFSRKGELME